MTLSSCKRESVEMNSSDMPSAKYSLAGSPVELSSGRTAIDLSGIGAAVVSLTPWRSTKRSVSSDTTATANTPMIAKSSLRPVRRVIDSPGSISLSRLKPSGVNS
jgi:hypothetical protein